MSIAQLNRATGCGPVGRGFESLWAYHSLGFFKVLSDEIFRFCFFTFLFINSLQAQDKTQKAFEILSDVLQFLPALSASYSLAIKDYEGLKELAIGFGTTIGVTLISKASLNALAKKYPQKLQIALRPNHANYEGFPSGHTSSAFSAAGYMQRRYGWKWRVPMSLLATLTGISRVVANKHTPVQVIAGAMLGFGVSYLVASRYIDPSIDRISFKHSKDIRQREAYSLSYAHSF